MKRIRIEYIITLVAWFTLIGLIAATSILFNDGTFVYTLDDPYIHLALAEEISKGNYGVNPGEFAAPSSSILWPLLLTPFARLPHGDLAPLAINCGCLFLAIILLHRRLIHIIKDDPGSRYLGPILRSLAASSVLLCMNSAGSLFSGMEHTLQSLLVLIVVDAVLTSISDERIRWWHYLALAMAPLIRYENLAFAAPVSCYLFFVSPKRPLLISMGFSMAALVGFSLFLYSKGLPGMASSVVAKSGWSATDGGILSIVLGNISKALVENRGLALASLTFCLVAFAISSRKKPAIALAISSVAMAGLLHLCFGSYGWFHRYEPHVIGGLSFGVLALVLGFPRSNTASHLKPTMSLIVLASIILSFPYLQAIPQLPIASNNVYQQQYQLHRFLEDHWKRPVAVNDLGWTTFRNDQHVLDLWGLGSFESLTSRLEGTDPDWMGKTVSKHQIELVAIYDEWFLTRPPSWTRVGDLNLGRRVITAGSSQVSFYATNPDAADEIEALLRDFRPTLPGGCKLYLRGEPRFNLFQSILDAAKKTREDSELEDSLGSGETNAESP